MRLNNDPTDCDKEAPRVEPGQYHVEIIDVTEEPDGDDPSTRFDLQVRGGTNPDMVNRIHRERIWWYSNSDYGQRINQNQICLFAIRGGLTTKEALTARYKANEDVEFDWGKAVGRHLVVQLQEWGKETKRIQIKPGCIWATDDPAVAQVPKDEKAIDVSQADNF